MNSRALIEEADRLTMAGHIRQKLRLGRRHLDQYRTRGMEKAGLPPLEGASASAADDMQLLNSEIHINELPPPGSAPSPSKLPLLAAIMLGLGAPTTAGVVMAPQIIRSLAGEPTPAIEAKESADYIPVLLPGRPREGIGE